MLTSEHDFYEQINATGTTTHCSWLQQAGVHKIRTFSRGMHDQFPVVEGRLEALPLVMAG